MVKYNLTKVESAAGAAVVVGDYLMMSGDPLKQVIGYAVLAGIGAYFGKHFISNAMAAEQTMATKPA